MTIFFKSLNLLTGQRPWLAPLLLTLLTVVTYSNTLHDTGFVMDSHFVILQDERVHSASLENLRQIFTQDYWQVTGGKSGLYRPLTTLSYLFNYAILGNGVHSAGYHLFNTLLHTLNAILVYLMIRALHGSWGLALGTAAIFAVHPINVESVANLVGRADGLAACAALAGFLCYVRAGEAQGGRKIPWLAAMMLVVTLGLFCKETAIVILVLAVLYDVAFRLRARHGHRLWSLCLNAWDFFRQGYVAFIPPLCIFFAVRRLAFADLNLSEDQYLIFIDNPMVGVDFWAARLTAIKVLGSYLALLLWPRLLSCDYSYHQIPVLRLPFQGWADDWQVLLALAAVVALVWLGVRQRTRQPLLFFCIFLFFGAFLPTANLLPRPGEPLLEPESWVNSAIMAERFMYLPSIGFAGGLAMAVGALCGFTGRRGATEAGAWPDAKKMTAAVLLLLTLGLAARTFQRNRDWESDLALWSSAARNAPNSAKVHLSLAMLALGDGDLDRAIAEGERGLAITDRYLPVMLNLGIAYRQKGDSLAGPGADGGWAPSGQGRPWYEKSAAVLHRAAGLDRALNEERRARLVKAGRDAARLEDIGEPGVYENLGLAQLRLGNPQGALEAYRALRRLAPFERQAYLAMAKILQAGKDFKEAAISLHQAVLLGDDDPAIGQTLIELYRQLDPQGCALDGQQGRVALDTACPLVRQQICQASFDLVAVLVQAKQFDAAWQLVQAGLRDSYCPPELYRPLMPDPGAPR